MRYIKVKNWDSFQQYRDRDPKWIKLHRDVLDDYEFDALTEIQQCHLIKIWLLAAKLGNEIPNDTKWIAKKIGAQSKVDIDQLVTSGFLLPYGNVHDCTETYLEGEREESRERGEEETPLSGKPDRSLEIESVFAHWQERCEHPRAKLDDKRRRAIRARLKDGYTADDLKRAVDGCAVSAWHQGDNDRAQKFDDIELICRDGKHVDQFLKIADDPAAGSGMSSAGRKTAAAAREFLND